MTKSPLNILLVAPLDLCREAIATILDKMPNTQVCASTETAREAIPLIAEKQPDIIITEVSLPDRSGIEFIKDVKALYPNLKILAVSSRNESLYAERAVRAGANGFTLKSITFKKLENIIQLIASDQLYLSTSITSNILQNLNNNTTSDRGNALLNSLSDREIQVFELIGKAFSNQAIAEQLSISTRTVDTHKARIKEKLQITDNQRLFSHAIKWTMEYPDY